MRGPTYTVVTTTCDVRVGLHTQPATTSDLALTVHASLSTHADLALEILDHDRVTVRADTHLEVYASSQAAADAHLNVWQTVQVASDVRTCVSQPVASAADLQATVYAEASVSLDLQAAVYQEAVTRASLRLKVAGQLGNEWVPRAPMPAPRYGAASYPDGSYLNVIGGGAATHFRYNSITNTWSSSSDAPVLGTGYAGADGVGAVYWYVVGSGSLWAYYQDVIGSGLFGWYRRASPPDVLTYSSAVHGPIGLHVVGGRSGSLPYASHWRYHFGDNTWTVMASAPASVVRPIWVADPPSSDRNVLWLVGGDSAGTVARYRHSSNTWVTTYSSMPVPVRYAVGGWLDTDTIWVQGGLTSTDEPTGATQVYHLPTDTWTFAADGPVRYDHAGGTLSGRFFSAGGRTAAGAQAENYEYIPPAVYTLEESSADVAASVYANPQTPADLRLSVHGAPQITSDLEVQAYKPVLAEPDMQLSFYTLLSRSADARYILYGSTALPADLCLWVFEEAHRYVDLRLHAYAPTISEPDLLLSVFRPVSHLLDLHLIVYGTQATLADLAGIIYGQLSAESDLRVPVYTSRSASADTALSIYLSSAALADLYTVLFNRVAPSSAVRASVYRPYATLADLRVDVGGRVTSTLADLLPTIYGSPTALTDLQAALYGVPKALADLRVGVGMRTVSGLADFALRLYSSRLTLPDLRLATGHVVVLRTHLLARIVADSITHALYVLLRADSQLAQMLATYKGMPAIFSNPPIPPDAEPPYVVILPARVMPDDTKNTLGLRVQVPVRVYTATTGSVVLLETIAERVYELLHRTPIAAREWLGWATRVSGPASAPSDPSHYALELIVDASLREVDA